MDLESNSANEAWKAGELRPWAFGFDRSQREAKPGRVRLEIFAGTKTHDAPLRLKYTGGVPALVSRRAPRSPRLAPRVVRGLAEAMLEELDLAEAELSVLLTDDRTIHALNLQHRDKDKPTDVLAFPLPDHGHGEPRLLGDVVISLDTAQRQAASRKRELLAEVRFLLAHGLLHLVGHDHDTAPKKRRMDAMARKLVRSAPLPEQSAAPAKRRSARRAR